MARQVLKYGHGARAELPLSDGMKLVDGRNCVLGFIVFERKAVEGYRTPRRWRDGRTRFVVNGRARLRPRPLFMVCPRRWVGPSGL